MFKYPKYTPPAKYLCRESPSRSVCLNIQSDFLDRLILILIIYYFYFLSTLTCYISSLLTNLFFFTFTSFYFFSFPSIYLTSQPWACFLKRCFEVKDLQSRSNALHRGALIAVCCAPIGVCYAHIESLRSHGITALT